MLLYWIYPFTTIQQFVENSFYCLCVRAWACVCACARAYASVFESGNLGFVWATSSPKKRRKLALSVH